jgi:hypothetical protein
MRGKSLFSEIVVGIFANQDPGMMILVLVVLGLGVKDIQADRIDSDAIERREVAKKRVVTVLRAMALLPTSACSARNTE